MKNKSSFIYLMFCGLILLSTSCAYKPQLTSIPLLEKKGDFQIDGTLSPVTISASLTASYAITDHFAVQVFGDASPWSYYGQGAIGYYNHFGNGLILENYIGFGYGYSNDLFKDLPLSIDENYRMGYTQVNFGKRHNTNPFQFDYGAGIKIGYLQYNAILHSNYEWIYLNQPVKIITTPIEPNIFIRFGGKHLKFLLQANLCFFHQWNYRNKVIENSIFNMGFGISYRFSTLKNSKR